MRVTINIPDQFVPEVQNLMDETGARSFGDLFNRAIGFYIYIFRLVHGGLNVALLNQQYEIEGRLIDRKLFLNLFREEDADSTPSKN